MSNKKKKSKKSISQTSAQTPEQDGDESGVSVDIQAEPMEEPQAVDGAELCAESGYEPEDDAGEAEENSARIEETSPSQADEPESVEDVSDLPAEIDSIEEEEPEPLPPEQAKPAIEALLFASGEPISARRLAHALRLPVADLRPLIQELSEQIDAEGRGLCIQEVAGGYQLSTRAEYAEWILRLLKHKRRSPLSPAALETLAIVAYKQPVVRADLEAIRGVESGGVLRTLMDLELVEVKGRRETIGRPPLYGTTDGFLRAFGLRELKELPTIGELRDRYQVGKTE